ncbi:unnamed protein product, partial [Urochloa humidicola]
PQRAAVADAAAGLLRLPQAWRRHPGQPDASAPRFDLLLHRSRRRRRRVQPRHARRTCPPRSRLPPPEISPIKASSAAATYRQASQRRRMHQRQAMKGSRISQRRKKPNFSPASGSLSARTALMAAVIRKRPAQDGLLCPAAVAGDARKKRPRYQFGSIYNYEKLEALGEGTYGVMVKARDLRTGETVAIKWIRPDAAYGGGAPDLHAVFCEAGCLSACRGHPSFVHMKEVAADEVTGHVFIVMEFVGPSLDSCLTRCFSEGEARAAMCQLLRGAERPVSTAQAPSTGTSSRTTSSSAPAAH